jgi:hypothetical protein
LQFPILALNILSRTPEELLQAKKQRRDPAKEEETPKKNIGRLGQRERKPVNALY